MRAWWAGAAALVVAVSALSIAAWAVRAAGDSDGPYSSTGPAGVGTRPGATPSSEAPSSATPAGPDSTGGVTLPDDYRTWVFVGSSTGLSYREPPSDASRAESSDPGLFHHTYINPQAFVAFRRTGTFPEGTRLVLELYRPERKVSIQRRGWFEGERVAVEMSMKDHSRFEEGWAYFSFEDGKRTAEPFPRDACWSCHHEHGDDDNVFTQFYPVLREAKAALRGTGPVNGSAGPEGN